ncbi:MAG: sugar phosphate isomerase/epimerase [Schlesneria sp.]|nr:sugar phosphate isomerase/epimerase [Schlesneria sp.]
MTLNICFSTLACPDWNWHDVLKYGSQFGFDGVEIRLLSRETDLLKIADLRPTEWLTRRRELVDAGFRVAGLASSVHFDDIAASDRAHQIEIGKRYLELCSALGGEFIRVFGDILPAPGDPNRSAMIRQIAEGLVTLADFAAPAGIQILLETHGDFSASQPCVEAMQLANHPHVGLVWDTHHPWRFHQEPLVQTWSQIRPWTRHTHWKDSVTLPARAATTASQTAANAASQLMTGHRHADYVLFGGGEFPAFECLQLLRDDHYSGWYSLEWEKMWHPELMGPEISLPLFPQKLREFERYVQSCTER